MLKAKSVRQGTRVVVRYYVRCLWCGQQMTREGVKERGQWVWYKGHKDDSFALEPECHDCTARVNGWYGGRGEVGNARRKALATEVEQVLTAMGDEARSNGPAVSTQAEFAWCTPEGRHTA